MVRDKIEELIKNIDKFKIKKRQFHTIFQYDNIDIDVSDNDCCLLIDCTLCEITKEEKKYLVKNLSPLVKTFLMDNQENLINEINFNK